MRWLVAAVAFVFAVLTSSAAYVKATARTLPASPARPASSALPAPPALPAFPALPAQSNSSSSSTPQRALLDRYCVSCHNQRAKVAGVTFDTMDLGLLSVDAEVWEKAVRKLRAGMMPPPGSRRPDEASVESFVSWLERSLDEAALAQPNPGRVALHRLNRVEYANAIDDLLGLKIDAAALLPKDDEADGFDNVASVLTVSPSFLESVHLRGPGCHQPRARQSVRPSGQQHVPPRARNRPGCAR